VRPITQDIEAPPAVFAQQFTLGSLAVSFNQRFSF
jgi:hypothetical protein